MVMDNVQQQGTWHKFIKNPSKIGQHVWTN